MLPHCSRVCINKEAFCNAVTSRFSLQAALSHGLQHENALVRYATLCVLCRTFSSLRLLMADLAAAADLAALPNEERRQQGSGFSILSSGGSGSAAAQWAAWGGRLGGWLRGRLPDPQVLLALHSALQATEVRPQSIFVFGCVWWLSMALHELAVLDPRQSGVSASPLELATPGTQKQKAAQPLATLVLPVTQLGMAMLNELCCMTAGRQWGKRSRRRRAAADPGRRRGAQRPEAVHPPRGLPAVPASRRGGGAHRRRAPLSRGALLLKALATAYRLAVARLQSEGFLGPRVHHTRSFSWQHDIQPENDLQMQFSEAAAPPEDAVCTKQLHNPPHSSRRATHVRVSAIGCVPK